MRIWTSAIKHGRRLRLLAQAGQGGDDAMPTSRSAPMWALLAGLLAFAGLQGMVGADGAVPVAGHHPLLQLLAGLLPISGGAVAGWLALRLIFPDGGWRRLGMTTPPGLEAVRGLKITLRLLLPVCLGCLLINMGTYLLLRAAGITDFPPQPLELLGRDAGVGYWLVAALVSIVLAPLVEEFVFRLLLFRTLQGAGLGAPGVLCALVFAGVHMLPYGIPGLAFLALILQGSARRWGLRQAMFLHGGYNAVMFSLLVLQRLLPQAG